MRIRRKPWIREELEKSEIFIKNPQEMQGKWNNIFVREQPVHLELGCGKGSFIAELASKNKQINYIAIDIKSEMLGLAKRNIEKAYNEKQEPIDNIILVAYEIQLIQDIINEQDKIERIYINFCNPWPKPRHNKRRLTYITQLEKYKKFLQKEGKIYFKTDDDNLFESTQKYLEQTGFTILEKTYDLEKENNTENIKTEHEEMFTKKGKKIKALIAKI